MTKRESPSRSEQSRLATAYHEAGHAVAHYFLRCDPVYRAARLSSIKRVTIRPGDGTLGHCANWGMRAFDPEGVGDEPPVRTRLRIEAEIVGLLAGQIAQRRFRGRAVPGGARDDHAKAANLALYLGGDGEGATALLRWLRIVTERLIAMHWKCVKAVAASLLEHETLTGHAVVAAIVDALGGPIRLRRSDVVS